jgi:hypothetical protein
MLEGSHYIDHNTSLVNMSSHFRSHCPSFAHAARGLFAWAGSAHPNLTIQKVVPMDVRNPKMNTCYAHMEVWLTARTIFPSSVKYSTYLNPSLSKGSPRSPEDPSSMCILRANTAVRTTRDAFRATRKHHIASDNAAARLQCQRLQRRESKSKELRV